MTKSDKVIVYTSKKLFEVEMIREYLSDHDITSFIMNKMDSSYHFGEIELLVPAIDELRVKDLIAEFHKK